MDVELSVLVHPIRVVKTRCKVALRVPFSFERPVRFVKLAIYLARDLFHTTMSLADMSLSITRASKGIGRATAVRIAGDGASIAASYLSDVIGAKEAFEGIIAPHHHVE